jgi:hypothetical protein
MANHHPFSLGNFALECGIILLDGIQNDTVDTEFIDRAVKECLAEEKNR